MKNIQYILPFTLLLAACSQPAEVLYPEADFASVKLSSGSAVISEDGGEKTVFIATNREEWDVQCIVDWVDISIEDNKITVYVDENPDKDSRLAVVDVIAGTKPDVAKARLKVLQKGAATADLSADGTANSYIAHTNASFRFDASVKGNGADDGNTFYIGYHGLEITEAAYADLAWESTFDADKTRSTKIISGAPVYSQEEQAVYFSTGETQGNAVISVHDAEGEILWSWHIWVSDEPVKTSKGNGLEWMDRNLGALNNDPEDIANRGMLYQWGRKDPFLPSPAAYREVPFHTYDDEGNLLETEEEYYAIQAQIEQARVALNINNTQTGDGSKEWEYVSVVPVALQAPGNIEHSVQNPTTVLGCRTDIPIGEYVFDWYLQQDLVGKNGSLQQSQSDLWGYAQAGTAYKTIFDPCPPGYCVPDAGVWSDFNSSTTNVNNPASPFPAFGSINSGVYYWPLPHDKIPESPVYYPASGIIQGTGGNSGTTTVYSVTSRRASKTTMRSMSITSSGLSLYRGDIGMNLACPVRCVTVRDVNVSQ